MRRNHEDEERGMNLPALQLEGTASNTRVYLMLIMARTYYCCFKQPTDSFAYRLLWQDVWGPRNPDRSTPTLCHLARRKAFRSQPFMVKGFQGVDTFLCSSSELLLRAHVLPKFQRRA